MEHLKSVAENYGLFVALVVYMLYFFQKLIDSMKRDNEARELRYIEVINKLSDSFHELKKDVEIIKSKVGG